MGRNQNHTRATPRPRRAATVHRRTLQQRRGTEVMSNGSYGCKLRPLNLFFSCLRFNCARFGFITSPRRLTLIHRVACLGPRLLSLIPRTRTNQQSLSAGRRNVANDFTSAAHMSCPHTQMCSATDQSLPPHSSRNCPLFSSAPAVHALTTPEVIIKQVIKSRILADCWKKHPTHGTIPIEIYVLLALSSALYVLPERRPWDPRRGIWRAERLARRLREDKQRADSQSSYGEFNPPPSATSTTSNSTVTNGVFGQDQEHEEDPSALVAPEDKKPQTLEEKYREYIKVMQPQWEWEEAKIVEHLPAHRLFRGSQLLLPHFTVHAAPCRCGYRRCTISAAPKGPV